MDEKILADIRKELQSRMEPAYKEQNEKFFKEQVKMFGVRTPVVRDLASRYFPQARRLKKKELFALCARLLRSGQSEEATVAFDWAWRARGHFEPKDFETFEHWISHYVSNWASCDDLCTHILGYFLTEFPEFAERVKAWSRSQNRWMRRAAAVSFIYGARTTSPRLGGARKKKFLKDIMEVSDALLKDADDLVQKGYGWALKEASNVYPREVFQYVMKRKKEMPRTALRYAIEKLPPRLRQTVMH